MPMKPTRVKATGITRSWMYCLGYSAFSETDAGLGHGKNSRSLVLRVTLLKLINKCKQYILNELLTVKSGMFTARVEYMPNALFSALSHA